MDLSHRIAFELFQRSIDGLLDAGQRAELESHLATCAECQTYAALHRRLEVQTMGHYPTTLPSRKEIERTIREIQKDFRRWRMINRFFINPVRTVAWTAAAVALVFAVIWVFDIARQQNQTGSPGVRQIIQEPAAGQVEVTREVQVTREVAVIPVFDAESEKEAVVAVALGIDEVTADPELEAVLAPLHEDLIGFSSYPDLRTSWAFADAASFWQEVPWNGWWDDYEVLMSPDLAVILGNRSRNYQDVNHQDMVVHYFATAVFRKEFGEWRLIHHHGSYAGSDYQD